MVQEIFIVTPEHKVLLGDPAAYPSNPAYPVHTSGGMTLCQLKCNNVILSILYKGTDGFHAARRVNDIRAFLETHIGGLTAATVESSYFKILELLHTFHDPAPKELSLWNKISMDNVYLDVVESVHTIIAADGSVVHNMIHGDIVSDAAHLHNFEMQVDKSVAGTAVYKTEHRMTELTEKLDLQIRQARQSSVLLSYGISGISDPIITASRDGNQYKFSSTCHRRYKFLRIVIPVSTGTYAAQVRPSTGSAKFVMEESAVVWEVLGEEFHSGTIHIEKMAYDEDPAPLPIRIYFSIPEFTSGGIKVGKCRCKNTPGTKFWARYTTQDGYYEIQQG